LVSFNLQNLFGCDINIICLKIFLIKLTKLIRNNLQPIFDLYDVDLVISGHVHTYERSKPLIFNNTITDNSTFSYIDPEGQVYITVGTGGRSLYSEWRNVSEWSIIQYSDDYGFLNINLENNGKKISADFITNKGNVMDSFQIVK